MKYTNGKKADASTFPFKEPPLKQKFGEDGYTMPGLGMLETMSGIGTPTTDKSHTHTQEYIVDEEGETSSNSLAV